MKVVLSKNIKKGINNYRESLKREPYLVSEETRLKKVDSMYGYILSAKYTNPSFVCTHTQLGQIKDEKGNPLDKGLKQFIYTDEGSKSSWTFSFTMDVQNDVLYVLQMSFSSHLKDSKTNVRYPFLTGLLEYRNKTMA